MPITAQAEKKLRHDRKRTKQNASIRRGIREVVKSMRSKPSKKTLSQVHQVLDKAVKTNVIHQNTSARLKSRLSHLLVK